MARLVGFTQDPQGLPGMGDFHFDDGQRLYAHDPEMAELALNGAEGGAGYEDMGQGGAGGGPPAPPPSAADVGPSYAPPSEAAPPSPQAGPPAPPPPPQGQAQPEGQPQGSPALDQAQQQTQAITNYVNAPVRVAPTKGGFVPKTKSESYEAQGPAYSAEDAQRRMAANEAVQAAHIETANAQAQRSAGEAAAYRAAQPELIKQAAIAQKQQDDNNAAYRSERAHLEQMITESEKNEKSFNPNRWFEDRGVVGTIGATLAQAFGAYAATLSGGENWAKKVIDDSINRDIMQQREAIESGKRGVSNALQKLNLRYNDLDQSSAALKLAMQRQTDNQIAAYAAATKSQDIMGAANEWLAQNKKDALQTEFDFYSKSIGKRTGSLSGNIVAPSAGGWQAPTEKTKQERLGTLKGFNEVNTGVYKTEQERQEAMGGGKKAEKATDAVQKYGEKRYQLDSADLAIGRSVQELRSIQARHGGAIPGIGVAGNVLGFGTVGHTVGATVGSEYSKDALRANQIINNIKNIGASANKGPASDQDIERIMSGITGAGTEDELFNGLSAMQNLTRDSITGLGGAFGDNVVQRYEQQRREVLQREAANKGRVR